MTRWSLVASVRKQDDPEGKALEELCESYWTPLYAFARRQGSETNDAADLIQGFFLKVIEKDYFSDADEDRGRLRTFLLASFKNFVANEWKKDNAAKRGGPDKRFVYIDADHAESTCGELATSETPEKIFERQWALSLLRTVMSQLRQEYDANKRGKTFKILRPYLSWNGGEVSYAEAAAELEVSVNTVKSGVFRLRKRYRKCLRQAVADTLQTGTEEEIDEELQHLMVSLGS